MLPVVVGNESSGCHQNITTTVTKPMVSLSDTTAKSFTTVYNAANNTQRINSMSFSTNGNLLLTASDDDRIITYNVQSGTQTHMTHSKKYGVNLIRFNQHNNTEALYASSKVNNDVRLLSLEYNRFLIYYRGHSAQVCNICTHSTIPYFITGANDNTIRFWDYRTSQCYGIMSVFDQPLMAIDPEGSCFAIGQSRYGFIKLYDTRCYQFGPFCTFNLHSLTSPHHRWYELKFSPNGKELMLTTGDDSGRCYGLKVIYILHAFKQSQPQQQLKRKLFATVFTDDDDDNDGHGNDPLVQHYPIQVCYSNDSQHIYAASIDGMVRCWNAKSDSCVAVYDLAKEMSKMKMMHDDEEEKDRRTLTTTSSLMPIYSIQYNPKMVMFATGGDICTSFWVPINAPLVYG